MSGIILVLSVALFKVLHGDILHRCVVDNMIYHGQHVPVFVLGHAVITEERNPLDALIEGVNHVKRDWLEILNVNCDLYLFFCVKRDWGYLRET